MRLTNPNISKKHKKYFFFKFIAHDEYIFRLFHISGSIFGDNMTSDVVCNYYELFYREQITITDFSTAGSKPYKLYDNIKYWDSNDSFFLVSSLVNAWLYLRYKNHWVNKQRYLCELQFIVN
jgi:hypothetical protein